MGYLQANYLHDLSHDGEVGWLAKHRRYARAEAREILANRSAHGIGDLLTTNRLQRRRAIKKLSYALPLRPVFRFVYQYVLRRGFLDGAAGWRYCQLLAQYEGFCAAELRELRRHP
jgi:hypothetical protein